MKEEFNLSKETQEIIEQFENEGMTYIELFDLLDRLHKKFISRLKEDIKKQVNLFIDQRHYNIFEKGINKLAGSSLSNHSQEPCLVEKSAYRRHSSNKEPDSRLVLAKGNSSSGSDTKKECECGHYHPYDIWCGKCNCKKFKPKCEEER